MSTTLPSRTPRSPRADKPDRRFRIGDRRFTAAEVLDLVVRDPEKAAALARHGGVHTELSHSLAATLQDSALSDHLVIRPLNDDDSVASADFGAIVDIIIVVGVIACLAAGVVGYEVGKSDGLKTCQDQSSTDSSDGDTSDDDTGSGDTGDDDTEGGPS